MAVTENTYTGNGSTVLYSFTFPYLATTDIKVSLNGVNTTAYTLANATTVQFNTAPSNGAAIRIYRSTDDSTVKATFFPGSSIRAADLNDDFTQALYIAQETANFAASTDATAIQATANTALANSNTAITTANAANATANGIAATANTALSNSTTAISTANSASSTATSALSVANAALPKAGGTMTGPITFTGGQTFPISGIQSASTTQQGIVQLTNSTSSTSTTTAATPSSVKSAFDTATSAQTTANAALPLTGGTLTGNLNIPSLNGGPLSGTRNRIINGAMRIDQRNNGSAVSITTDSYTLDRWFAFATGGGVFSVQRDSTTPPAGFSSSLKVTVTTADTSLASTDEYAVVQFIEGFNTADFGFGAAGASTLTVSFWVRSSVTGSHGFALKNSALNRTYVTSYTVSAANTWEYKTLTIPGNTTGTWLTDSNKGLEVHWSLGCGSGKKGTAGSWFASNNNAPTGTVDLIGTASATLSITGVQLETGSVATPFERRSYGHELALCQRYFLSATTSATLNVSGSTANVSFVGNFPVTMRTAPNITGPTASFTTTNNFTAFANTAGLSWAGNVAFTASSEL